MSVSCSHHHLDSSPSDEVRPQHTALLYAGDQDYLDGITRFIEPALTAGEPVAVALPPERSELVRTRLNAWPDRVKVFNMFEVGRNPARIIPEVEGLLAGCEGTTLHYVSEPIWPGRSPEEIQEATRHEALINVAWPEASINVLCPYDAATLDREVLADAERTHPYLIRAGRTVRSEAYRGPGIPPSADAPLSPPAPDARSIAFTVNGLFRVRALVSEVAEEAGLAADRIRDLLLVATELGANAIRHGEGSGVLHAWSRANAVSCQVHDRGRISDPLAGRRRPLPTGTGGLGLWIVHQLCDLVEVRTGEQGTTVRAHIGLG